MVWIQSIQGRRFSAATGPVAPSTIIGTRSHQALNRPIMPCRRPTLECSTQATGSLAPSRANPGFRFVMDVVRLKAPHLRSGRRDPPTFGMPRLGGAAMRHIARPDTLKRLSHSAIFCLHAAKEGISLPRFGGADQCRLAAGQFTRTGGEKFCNSPM